MLKGVQRGAIMLVKCLEHKSYEEQPKEQEFFSLEEAQETPYHSLQRRLWRGGGQILLSSNK